MTEKKIEFTQVPVFNGKSTDPSTPKPDPQEWIDKINSLARVNKWTEDDKLSIVPVRLEGIGLSWYKLYETETKDKKFLNPSENWKKLVKAFIRHFRGKRNTKKILDFLNKIEQGKDETVSLYLARFHEKASLLTMLDDQQAFTLFGKGLRKDIRHRAVDKASKKKKNRTYFKLAKIAIQVEEDTIYEEEVESTSTTLNPFIPQVNVVERPNRIVHQGRNNRPMYDHHSSYPADRYDRYTSASRYPRQTVTPC